MKRKYKPIKDYPGIYQIQSYDEKLRKWRDPVRGKKFRSTFSVKVEGKYKKVKRDFRSFEEAKDFRFNQDKSLASIELRTQLDSSMTFMELTDAWVANELPNREISTQIRYRSYLKHFKYFNDMRVEEITPSIVDGWLNHVKTKEYLAASNPTRCNYKHEFSVLRGLFTYYQTRFNLDFRIPFVKDHRNKLKVREQFKEKKDLNLGDLYKFLSALKSLVVATDYEFIYYLAWMQYGIFGRTQEAAALHYEDFDLINKKIKVRRKVIWPRGKGVSTICKEGLKASSCKVVPMLEEVEQKFREWTIKSGVRSGPLFQFRGKTPEYRQLEYRFSKALKKAGLPFTGTYILRHASLTEYYAINKDIQATKTMAGHTNLSSTQRYVGSREDTLIENHRIFNERLRNSKL